MKILFATFLLFIVSHHLANAGDIKGDCAKILKENLVTKDQKADVVDPLLHAQHIECLKLVMQKKQEPILMPPIPMSPSFSDTLKQDLKKEIIAELKLNFPASNTTQELCKYEAKRNNYDNCKMYQATSELKKYDPEGKSFRNAQNLPTWMEHGLNAQGVYSQKILIHTIEHNYFKDLIGANLNKADLRGINLRDVNFKNANLRYANLSGTHFGEAGEEMYSGADLEGAIWVDGRTCGANSIGQCR